MPDKKRTKDELIKSYALLHALEEAQGKYISDTDPKELFDKLLGKILKITESEYGFIGQLLENDKGEPYLKNFATTNIAWNKETRKFYEENEKDGLEFSNMKSLFGLVITSGAAVISNDPSTDKRGCGIPEGHPPLNAFLGLPCYMNDKLVGMVAIANRPGGYDEESIELLSPLLSTTANIIEAFRNNIRRKEAEEKLHNYKILFNNMTDMAYMLNNEGIILYMNKPFEKLSGFKVKEFIGHSFAPLFEGINLERAIESFTKTIEGEALTFELEFKKSGIVCEYTSMPLKDMEGRIIGALGTARDVTEKRLADKKLEKSEALLMSVIDNSTTVVYVKDMDGRYLLINSTYEKLFHIKKEAILGKCDHDVFPEDMANAFHANDLKVLEAGEAIEFEEIAPHDDGPHTYISIKFPLKDSNGNPYAVCGISTDITERTLIEADRLKMQKLESIGVLAGGIAHDFNNLLTGILGNISLSMMGLDPNDKIYKRLKEAEKSSFFARDLTQQLLTFSKGGAPIKETLPIEELIKVPAELALRGSGKRCVFEIAEGLPNVDVDRGQIGQAINNLVINADQAMPEGGIIKLSAEKKTIDTKDHLPLKDGDYLVVRVADEGTGIPPKHIPKIFDPYFTTKQKGSGLGLASVYSIIKNHAGHIDLTSEVGKGTTFNIYLPVSDNIAAARIIKEDEEIKRGQGRVLIMDDEEIIRELLNEFLSQLGYETESVSDGLEAVKVYMKSKEAGRPFKAVIMDLTIQGGVGGKEAIKLLLKEDPQARVIVSSGYSNDPVVANYGEYGFSGYLNKPYKVIMLSKVLDTVINGRKE